MRTKRDHAPRAHCNKKRREHVDVSILIWFVVMRLYLGWLSLPALEFDLIYDSTYCTRILSRMPTERTERRKHSII